MVIVAFSPQVKQTAGESPNTKVCPKADSVDDILEAKPQSEQSTPSVEPGVTQLAGWPGIVTKVCAFAFPQLKVVLPFSPQEQE